MSCAFALKYLQVAYLLHYFKVTKISLEFCNFGENKSKKCKTLFSNSLKKKDKDKHTA